MNPGALVIGAIIFLLFSYWAYQNYKSDQRNDPIVQNGFLFKTLNYLTSVVVFNINSVFWKILWITQACIALTALYYCLAQFQTN